MRTVPDSSFGRWCIGRQIPTVNCIIHLPELAMQRRHLLVLLGTSPLALHGHTQPTSSLPLGTAINRAGRLRALSQRLAKLHVQSTLGVLPDRARDLARQCRQLIESSLEELGRQPMGADTQSILSRLQGHVERLLALTAGSSASTRTEDVIRAADEMLRSADDLTTAFEKQSNQSGARVVNVAGRQRMLSQRAARAYFLQAAGGTASSGQGQQLDAARREFDDGLGYLANASLSTPAIRQQLELARGQWLFFEQALRKPGQGETLQTVATTSERMYEVMDHLTSLYDQAVRELFR